jgi:hypothetical protein
MGKLVGGVIEKHKIAWKIRMQISNFCQKFHEDYPNLKESFFHQIVYGIQTSMVNIQQRRIEKKI